MNFITYERAYCLYPLETLEKFSTLLLVYPEPDIDIILGKYDSRGYSFQVSTRNNEFRYKDERWVEDSHCFVLSLPPFRSYAEDELFIDPIRITSWSIMANPGSTHSIKFNRSCYIIDEDKYPAALCSDRATDTIQRFASLSEEEAEEWNMSLFGEIRLL